MTKRVAGWLEQKLDFPDWSTASVQRQQETHIGNWAASEGVEMDRLYATEEREGGTRALGERIPGLSRRQLSVFSHEQWSDRRDELTLESWLKRVSPFVNRRTATPKTQGRF